MGSIRGSSSLLHSVRDTFWSDRVPCLPSFLARTHERARGLVVIECCMIFTIYHCRERIAKVIPSRQIANMLRTRA
jgi:hypothetical protein